MSKLHVDVDLITKYNVPGPRYTSYPPATHFTEGLDGGDLRRMIAATNDTSADLSLYFHIPFCYSLCWYCGCTTVITTRQTRSENYLCYLAKQMTLTKPLLNPDRTVAQFHFGGGTPTFLKPSEIRRLGGIIRSNFRIASDAEASVEIDPRRLTLDHVRALREIGVNRASIGVQDTDPDVQRAVHRIQPKEMTEEVVSWLRDAGFKSLNIDLIYGLPLQTPASFERTLDEMLEMRPDRLAVFSYAHVPWIKRHQRILKDETLPTPQAKLAMLKLTIEKLTAADYVYIGMDHFAKAGDDLAIAQRAKTLQRNFQGYSTKGGLDIYGFGMSAISQAGNLYWQQQKTLTDYCRMLDDGDLPLYKAYVMNEDDTVRRTTIMRLMCDLELDFAAMSEQLGVVFTDYFAAELDSLDDLEADGLLRREPPGIQVTDLGRLLIRNIAMRFDAYLPQEAVQRYSRTI